MNKRILVTGGTGYIGSHTVVELINSGFNPVIVDNLSNSDVSVIDNIEKITGVKVPFELADCCDTLRMKEIFSKYEFSSIIHFAAYKAVGESVEKPLEYYKNNIYSLIVMLEMARQFGVNNIVFSSSCTVYGQPDILPATERTPFKKATSPYGNSKKMCEDILADFTNITDGIQSIALRYFNPIGSHPSALIGEKPKGIPNNLLPYVTQTAAGIRECLSVFGDDYNTPDGTAVRDYIDVQDLARAHVISVNRMVGGLCKSKIEFFNIGTGVGVSVLELIKSFEKINNLKLNYKIAPRREGDIEAVWADAKYANEELGWRAEVSLDETLRNVWNWEQTLHN